MIQRFLIVLLLLTGCQLAQSPDLASSVAPSATGVALLDVAASDSSTAITPTARATATPAPTLTPT